MSNIDYRFQRVYEQDVISNALQTQQLSPKILDGIPERDLRLIDSGTLGIPFERYVSHAIQQAGLQPLIPSTFRVGRYELRRTSLFGGVVVADGHTTILELDSLVRATAPDFTNTPMIVEAKFGKPHNAFNPVRMRECVSFAQRAARSILHLNENPRVAFTVVTPERKFSMRMKPWEREIENQGGRVIRTSFTLGDFHKQLLQLIRTRAQ